MMLRHMTTPLTPTVEAAREAARLHGGCEVSQISRFATGICHYVYDVRLVDGRELVVRLTVPERRRDFEGALYWYDRLLPMGIPLARILHSDLTSELPLMLLERLPGTDLGKVYARLSSGEKREIARHVADIQIRVGSLPEGPGFGWATSYEDPGLRKDGDLVADWRESLIWKRNAIRDRGHCDPSFADRVAALIPSFVDYASNVRPRPCLEDTTTKNVIIDRGRFSGLVDVDGVLFGDVLSAVGLTQMSLLCSGYDTDYIEYWCEFMEVNATRRRVVDFYSAHFGLAFMTEVGQAFNRGKADVDPQRVERLHDTLDALLGRLSG